MRRLIATIREPAIKPLELLGSALHDDQRHASIKAWRMGLALLCLSLGLVGGCGWHLQGASHLPTALRSIYIDTDDRYSDFYRELRSELLASGAQIHSQRSVANAVIHISSDQAGQRAPSVSPYNQPVQYIVYYRITYSVDVAGAAVIPSQPLESIATYSYDANAVLGKQREQLGMQQALARDLAGQVLRRLASIDGSIDAESVAE